jgi:hypothetical protein
MTAWAWLAVIGLVVSIAAHLLTFSPRRFALGASILWLTATAFLAFVAMIIRGSRAWRAQPRPIEGSEEAARHGLEALREGSPQGT